MRSPAALGVSAAIISTDEGSADGSTRRGDAGESNYFQGDGPSPIVRNMMASIPSRTRGEAN